MKNTYKITVSDSDGLRYACTYVANRYTTYQVPHELLDRLGKKYAPCEIKCVCTNEGWFAEKDFS